MEETAEVQKVSESDSEGFSKLELERDAVPASEIFPDWEARRDRRKYRIEHKDDPEALNNLKIEPGTLPPELTHQDLAAVDLARQAEVLINTPLLQEIKAASHDDGAYQDQKSLTEVVAKMSIAQRRGKDIVLPTQSEAEIGLAKLCFARLWRPNIDLYGSLGEAYPAFHAQMVGHVPETVAGHEEELIVKGVTGSEVKAFPPLINGRFTGLYPIVVLDNKDIGPEAKWLSQDQLGRRELVDGVVKDAKELLDENPERQILVEDLAGGTGNLSELLVEKIFSMSEEGNEGEVKKKLLNNMKIVVREYSDKQIEGGRSIFKKIIERHPEVGDMVCFVQSDVTKPMDERQINELKGAFGNEYDPSKATKIGMTAYTAGAIPPEVLTGMAEEIGRECYSFRAVDFSSPGWREKQFLQQTGEQGKHYLRNVHGKPDQKDENTRLGWLVKKMALVQGLADHYNVWPGINGHNSGYTVAEDGNLLKPSIVELGQTLKEDGRDVRIKSTVRYWTMLYAGEVNKDKSAVAMIPGWVSDQIKVKIEENKH